MLNLPKIKLIQGCWILDQADSSGHLTEIALRLIDDIKEQLIELQVMSIHDIGLPWWVGSLCYEQSSPFIDDQSTIELICLLQDVVSMPKYKVPHVCISSTGSLNASAREAFSVQAILFDTTDNTVPAHVECNLWKTRSVEYIMPTDIAISLLEIHKGPPVIGDNLSDITKKRRLWWSRIYHNLKRYSIEVDEYLQNNETFYIEEWTPVLDVDSQNVLSLSLHTPDIEANEITPVLLAHPVQDEYSIRKRKADGTPSQKRIMLSPKAKKAVQTFQTIRKHWKEAAPRLLDAPETLLQEGFNLEDYSDRVIGLEVQVYRIHSVHTGNIPKISLQCGGGTTEKVLELTPDEEVDLANRLLSAGQQQQYYIQYKNVWVRVPTTDHVRRLLEQGNKRKIGTLQILENLESERFRQGGGNAGLASIDIRPPGLHVSYDLMPHQVVGYQWLAAHTGIGEASTDHGLLADDMGLGKTVQTLSVLSLLKNHHENFCALLIAPASLLQNWKEETERFFPNRFHNIISIDSNKSFQRHFIVSTDLVLCSYETLRIQQLELGIVEWTIIVTDESHRFKNPTTSTTKAILAMQSKYRLALSGTPIQNSLVDIWSQFDWLCPGFLGQLNSFKKIYKDASPIALQMLNQKLSSRFLRRTKEGILKEILPSKTIVRSFIQMTPLQQTLYDAVLQGFSNKEIVAFTALYQLKKICSEPNVLSNQSEFYMHPKMLWLQHIIKDIQKHKEKVIIFAEWYSLQGAIVTMLQEFFGIHVDILNGQVDSNLRLGKVQKFNNTIGFAVMVLSPTAGGVGLNIVGANHVVHFTRNWNPAIENQATDRVYRIGQKKPVTVYLPIMKHSNKKSIEEHIDAVLHTKEDIADQIIMVTDIEILQKEIEQALLKDM